MVSGLDTIVRSLVERGTDVLKPAGAGALDALNSELRLNIGPDFKNVYSTIDGFQSHDYRSQFTLWSIGDMISNGKKIGFEADKSAVRWLPIGDFLIDSDTVVAAVELEDAKVKLLHEDTELAESLSEFLSKISIGLFDFL